MSSHPVTLRIAALVEAVEGVFVVGAGLYVGIDAVVGKPTNLAAALVLALLGVLTGAGIVAVGWGLWTARRWSRAPAVLTQIFTFIIAWSMLQSHHRAVGGILIAVGVIGAVALFSPPTVNALTIEE